MVFLLYLLIIPQETSTVENKDKTELTLHLHHSLGNTKTWCLIVSMEIVKNYLVFWTKTIKSSREKGPNPRRSWCKEIDVYNTFIWAFIFTINMCFETEEKLSCKVHFAIHELTTWIIQFLGSPSQAFCSMVHILSPLLSIHPRSKWKLCSMWATCAPILCKK